MRKNNEQNNLSSRIHDVKIIHIREYACQHLEQGLEESIHFTTLNRVPLKFLSAWNLRMMKLAKWRRDHATLGWPLTHGWCPRLTHVGKTVVEDAGGGQKDSGPHRGWKWGWPDQAPGERPGQTFLHSLLEKPAVWHPDFRLQPPDCEKKHSFCGFQPSALWSSVMGEVRIYTHLFSDS